MLFKKGAPHATLSNGAVLSGALQFSREGRPYSSFIGIPYAAIPGRFEAAKLISGGTWKEGEVNPAVTPGPLSPQVMIGGKSKLEIDELFCLNLNVYVPMTNTGREGGLPVMVWIHGGAFMFGGGYEYGPKYFMDEEAILVTINYRLGIFGFLSTGDEVVPGNNGLKDQVLALRWVQENIAGFGGNPKNVTIFGESAGSVSVHYLMLSPTTEGLFQRAISQSGSSLAPWAYHPNPGEAARAVAAHLGCQASTSEEILAFLKGQPMATLLAAQFAFQKRWPMSTIPFSFGPVKEPPTSPSPFMTRSPWEIISDKDVPLKEIPWMIGSTEDEGATFYAGIILSSQELLDNLNSNWGSVAPVAFLWDKFLAEDDPRGRQLVTKKVREFYFDAKDICAETRVNLTNLYSDNYFLYSVYKAAMETASRGERNPVYLYQYAHRGPVSLFKLFGLPIPDEESQKVGHGDDILLQFNIDSLNPGPEPLIREDSAHEEFSKNFVKLWVSFAVHGEPKHFWGEDDPTFRKWNPITTEELNGTLPLKWYRLESNPITVQEGLNQDRMNFCDKLWSEHFIPTHLGHKVPPPAPYSESIPESWTENTEF